jgi:hypothetical protein
VIHGKKYFSRLAMVKYLQLAGPSNWTERPRVLTKSGLNEESSQLDIHLAIQEMSAKAKKVISATNAYYGTSDGIMEEIPSLYPLIGTCARADVN